ncbi:MAG: ABC transporter ATP-binding protein [Desulfobacteraceae bacterium]|jgi:lipopolysaccharide transport system ATP-binding protein
MTDLAIKTRELSKLYRIGEHVSYRTLRETIVDVIRSPFKEPFFGGKKCREISQNERHIWALKDISLDVKKGEVVGIIGPNGAGKSTLLKILSRITKPTAGYAEINGRVGSLLEVGTGFHPELTGRENIYLNSAILGMRKSEIEQKLEEIIAFAEIEKFLDTPVKRYSSGMYVRLAFAVAAHLEPSILLVDEVLAVGDAAFQKKCLKKMGDVAKEGRTILFVSHNMGAIRGLCGRAICLDVGRVIMDGDVKDTVNTYLDSINMTSRTTLAQVHPDHHQMVIERLLLKDYCGETTTHFEYGNDITIEIYYHAFNRIEKPYFWVGIASQYGSMFSANMLFDDLRPAFIEGKGFITCVFKNVHLMPQTYTVSVGARDKHGMKFLVPTIERAAAFNVIGDASDLGMSGELADLFLAQASPLRVSYEWRFMDGKVATAKVR